MKRKFFRNISCFFLLVIIFLAYDYNKRNFSYENPVENGMADYNSSPNIGYSTSTNAMQEEFHLIPTEIYQDSESQTHQSSGLSGAISTRSGEKFSPVGSIWSDNKEYEVSHEYIAIASEQSSVTHTSNSDNGSMLPGNIYTLQRPNAPVKNSKEKKEKEPSQIARTSPFSSSANNGGTPVIAAPGPPGEEVPLDGGVLFILAAGVALGWLSLRKTRLATPQ